jgi:hypothetical protein
MRRSQPDHLALEIKKPTVSHGRLCISNFTDPVAIRKADQDNAGTNETHHWLSQPPSLLDSAVAAAQAAWTLRAPGRQQWSQHHMD